MYHHFYELYPSDEKAEYASYKAALCKYKQRSRYDCDSTVVETTLALCDTHLKNSHYLRYRKDIEDLKQTCTERLVDKEVYVFNSYLNRHQFKSAQNRLKHLRETYFPGKPSLEPRLLFLEGKLARYQKKSDKVHDVITTLVEKYPDTRFARMAQGLVKKNFFFL